MHFQGWDLPAPGAGRRPRSGARSLHNRRLNRNPRASSVFHRLSPSLPSAPATGRPADQLRARLGQRVHAGRKRAVDQDSGRRIRSGGHCRQAALRATARIGGLPCRRQLAKFAPQPPGIQMPAGASRRGDASPDIADHWDAAVCQHRALQPCRFPPRPAPCVAIP